MKPTPREGNLSLYQGLRSIEEFDQLLEEGLLSPEGKYKQIVVRVIELSRSRFSRSLGTASKLNRDPRFIAYATCYVTICSTLIQGTRFRDSLLLTHSSQSPRTELLRSFGWTDIRYLGDITTARGTEMLLPVWLRLFGALQKPIFNFKIVR